MTILSLLSRVKDRIHVSPHPCINEEEILRVSYLTGVAMLAHSDGEIDAEEEKLFLELSCVFDLGEKEALNLLKEARNPGEEVVWKIREHLLHSKYKYYFILDLQIMAHQDKCIVPVEKAVLTRFCEILEIDEEDRRFLVGLADAVVEEDPVAKQEWAERFFTHLGDKKKVDLDYYTKSKTDEE